MTPVAEIAPPVLRAIESLQALAELFARRREQLALSVGLTVGQWQVLESVSAEHFMPSMFARQHSSSLPAVSRTLRQLLDSGLIAAAIDRVDGRQRRYRLTPTGERVITQLRAHRRQAIEKVWSKFSESQLVSFSDFAEQLSLGLDELVRENDPSAKSSVRKCTTGRLTPKR